MSNPIIDEIRAYRLDHAQKFDGDIHRICDDLRAYQKKCGHSVVRFEGGQTEKPKDVQDLHKT